MRRPRIPGQGDFSKVTWQQEAEGDWPHTHTGPAGGASGKPSSGLGDPEGVPQPLKPPKRTCQLSTKYKLHGTETLRGPAAACMWAPVGVTGAWKWHCWVNRVPPERQDAALTPGPPSGTLFGNRVMVIVTVMRSDWSRAASSPCDWRPSQKGRGHTERRQAAW